MMESDEKLRNLMSNGGSDELWYRMSNDEIGWLMMDQWVMMESDDWRWNLMNNDGILWEWWNLMSNDGIC